MLASVEEPAPTWISGVKELLLRGDELDKLKRSARRTETPRGPRASPGARRRAALAGTMRTSSTTTHAIVRAPASLPAGTLHVELRSKPLTKDAPPAHTTHLYVVPAGQRTWFGISEDDAALVDRLRVAVDPGRDEGTLGAAPDIDVLRRRGTLGRRALLAGWLDAARGERRHAGGAGQGRQGSRRPRGAAGARRGRHSARRHLRGARPGAARLDVRVRLTHAAIQDAIALLAR